MNAIATKMQTLETDQIVEIAIAAAARMDDEGDIVLDVALTVLELRMPEAEFVTLCDMFA